MFSWSFPEVSKGSAGRMLAFAASVLFRACGETPNSTTPPRADLVRSLRANGGNVSAVAREHGKLPVQLYRWFRRHKIRPADYRTQ